MLGARASPGREELQISDLMDNNNVSPSSNQGASDPPLSPLSGSEGGNSEKKP